MIKIDATFLLVLLSFILFMLGMRALYFEPVAAIKRKRAEKTASDTAAVHDAAEGLDALKRDYHARLTEARRQAQQVLLEARQHAKTDAKARVDQARSNARTTLESHITQLTGEREAAYHALSDDRQALSRLILQKVLPSGVTAEMVYEAG